MLILGLIVVILGFRDGRLVVLDIVFIRHRSSLPSMVLEWPANIRIAPDPVF